MAVRTSTQAGNLSASATWGGSAFVDGDSIVCNHAITVDVNATVGNAPPHSPLAVPSTNVTGGGAAGGTLPAGIYRVVATHVDSNGRESCAGPEPNTFNSASGNIPRVTLGSLPTGVASYNLYLTQPSGAVGTEHLYCTGITGSTVDLNGSLWGNTYAAGVASGGSTAYASAALPPNPAVTVNSPGSLTIGSAVVLKVRGDSVWSNAAPTLRDDSVWEFDSSASTSPANCNYSIMWGTADGQTSCKLLTVNTSFAHPAEVRSNSGGGNGWFRVQRQGVSAGYSDCGTWQVSNLKVTRIGDTGHDIEFANRNTSAQDMSLTQVIFDTCGRLNWRFTIGTAKQQFSKCSWKNTAASQCAVFTGDSTAGITRTLSECIFDKQVELTANGWTYTKCQFLGNPPYMPGLVANPWLDMNGCLVTFSGDNACYLKGPLTNSMILMKSPRTQLDTGTVSAATSTTLSDSTKTWTVNQFSPNFRAVSIQSGTGAGQIRRIISNSATQLVINQPWTTTPDAASVYKIFSYSSIDPNPYATVHGGSPAHLISGCVFHCADVAVTADGVICDLTLGSLSMKYNLFIPNGGQENSCTPFNLARITSGGTVGTLTFEHNTYYFAGQTCWVGEYNPQQAGALASFRYNLGFQYNDSVSLSSGAGSVLLSDIRHLTVGSGGTLDIVSPANADHNCAWNSIDGNYFPDYNLNESSAPGQHDLRLSGGVGPGFADAHRNLYTWALTLGSTGSYETVIDDAMAALASLNDFTGARSTYTIASLVSHIRSGHVPRAASVADSGDGTPFGALALSGRGGMMLMGVG